MLLILLFQLLRLKGVNPVTVPVGSIYVDAGASASDNYDGDCYGDCCDWLSVNTGVGWAYFCYV